MPKPFRSPCWFRELDAATKQTSEAATQKQKKIKGYISFLLCSFGLIAQPKWPRKSAKDAKERIPTTSTAKCARIID
jgi:hypothetical protein